MHENKKSKQIKYTSNDKKKKMNIKKYLDMKKKVKKYFLNQNKKSK